MVMWSKDHVTTIGFHNVGSWKFLVKHCLIRVQMGPLGGKRRNVGWEGWGECYGKPAPPRL
jgi:hypothetical protein